MAPWAMTILPEASFLHTSLATILPTAIIESFHDHPPTIGEDEPCCVCRASGACAFAMV